jgi:hypothetical protein
MEATMAQPKKHYKVKVIYTPVSKELAAIKREAVLSVIVQATLRRLREKTERAKDRPEPSESNPTQ